MTNPCNGVCNRWFATRLPRVRSGSKYKTHSYCTTCACWFDNEKVKDILRCPCCSTKLRRHARTGRSHALYVANTVRRRP